jgi:hypothetical protein
MSPPQLPNFGELAKQFADVSEHFHRLSETPDAHVGKQLLSALDNVNTHLGNIDKGVGRLSLGELKQHLGNIHKDISRLGVNLVANHILTQSMTLDSTSRTSTRASVVSIRARTLGSMPECVPPITTLSDSNSTSQTSTRLAESSISTKPTQPTTQLIMPLRHWLVNDRIPGFQTTMREMCHLEGMSAQSIVSLSGCALILVSCIEPLASKS